MINLLHNIYLPFKYKYNNLSHRLKNILNLFLIILSIFIISAYIYSLHVAYSNNIIKIINIKKQELITNNLVNNIPKKLSLSEVQQSLKQSNIEIISSKLNDDLILELVIDIDISKFINWLQGTRFKIKEISFKNQNNKIYISAILN